MILIRTRVDSDLELDPHGDDEQGNPLGGIVFTNGFGLNTASFTQQFNSNSTPSSSYTQVVEWVDFIGNGMFCLKMCNPDDSQDALLCNHIYDRVGCTYNAPADYADVNGTFQVCDSDDMTFPGVYVSDGITTTWTQGPEGVPVMPPYTPTVPASSNCQTFSSEQLFGAISTSASGSVSTTHSGSGSGSTSRSGSTAQKTAGAAVSISSGIPNIFFMFIAASVSAGVLLVL